jgi:superfamily II DNA or RNA helicase
LAHEGLDIPTLDCVVLATPKSNINQAVGRILRETPGKRFDPLIVDLMDIWGPFISQYQQRKRYYIETGFTLGEGNSNSSYVFQQDA